MNGEAVPDFCGHFASVHICQRLPGMNVEVVHDQVDRLGRRICQGQPDGHLSELEARSIRRGEREMTTRFRFYRAEDIGRAATLVLVVTPGLATRFGCGGGTN